MTTLSKEHLSAPITNRQQLVDYLAAGERPPSEWGIGLETEKLVVDRHSGEAATYPCIAAFMKRLEALGGWRGIYDNDHLVALIGPDSSITLEPGGQLELSGRLCPDMYCCCRDLKEHAEQIAEAASPLDLAFLGLGVQPFTPLNKIDWLPKARYEIMGPYMQRCGSMGQRMMKQSAGVQVNLDFSSEEDCITKMRLALSLVPVFYALFANSPFLDGQASGLLSSRALIWENTDRDRTGILPFLFRDDAGYDTYIDYALDVPMYFLHRQQRYIDLTQSRFTFRRFLAEGVDGEVALLSDWDLHLSTLFPEVRLRPQIEIRSFDSLPACLALAPPALLKGLFYDESSCREALALFADQDDAERHRLYGEAPRLGLETRWKDQTLRDLALRLLALAHAGLNRQRLEDGGDEGRFLAPAEEIALSGETLAQRLLKNWPQKREEQVERLIKHCGYAPLFSPSDCA